MALEESARRERDARQAVANWHALHPPLKIEDFYRPAFDKLDEAGKSLKAPVRAEPVTAPK
jgi:hypothetical protein